MPKRPTPSESPFLGGNPTTFVPSTSLIDGSFSVLPFGHTASRQGPPRGLVTYPVIDLAPFFAEHHDSFACLQHSLLAPGEHQTLRCPFVARVQWSFVIHAPRLGDGERDRLDALLEVPRLMFSVVLPWRVRQGGVSDFGSRKCQ